MVLVPLLVPPCQKIEQNPLHVKNHVHLLHLPISDSNNEHLRVHLILTWAVLIVGILSILAAIQPRRLISRPKEEQTAWLDRHEQYQPEEHSCLIDQWAVLRLPRRANAQGKRSDSMHHSTMI
jgi:hypothetical protein